jgi:hypothetical protein
MQTGSTAGDLALRTSHGCATATEESHRRGWVRQLWMPLWTGWILGGCSSTPQLPQDRDEDVVAEPLEGLL